MVRTRAQEKANTVAKPGYVRKVPAPGNAPPVELSSGKEKGDKKIRDKTAPSGKNTAGGVPKRRPGRPRKLEIGKNADATFVSQQSGHDGPHEEGNPETQAEPAELDRIIELLTGLEGSIASLHNTVATDCPCLTTRPKP